MYEALIYLQEDNQYLGKLLSDETTTCKLNIIYSKVRVIGGITRYNLNLTTRFRGDGKYREGTGMIGKFENSTSTTRLSRCHSNIVYFVNDKKPCNM